MMQQNPIENNGEQEGEFRPQSPVENNGEQEGEFRPQVDSPEFFQ